MGFSDGTAGLKYPVDGLRRLVQGSLIGADKMHGSGQKRSEDGRLVDALLADDDKAAAALFPSLSQ